jgi:hypothetical protein
VLAVINKEFGSMPDHDRDRVGPMIDRVVLDVKETVPSQIIEFTFSGNLHDVCVKFGVEDLERLIFDVFQWDKALSGKRWSKGFPGIVLTAIIGRLLDPAYNPSKDFYAINPRPLFEQHIGPALRDKYHVPMGKSDPLNVAKGISVIDESWAVGRKPEYAARASFRLIEWVTGASGEGLEQLLHVFIWAYLSLSKLHTRSLPDIQIGPDLIRLHLFLINLIKQAPAGGDTAQSIVGALLKTQHEQLGTNCILEGVGESVNATNTTSGKAGDFSEEYGDQINIYEVTTKKVDLQRINESADTIIQFINKRSCTPSSIGVTFLCNLDDVVIEGRHSVDSIVHEGIQFYFVDLGTWIFMMLERIGPNGRVQVIGSTREYAEAASTELSVKNSWRNLSENSGLQD